MSKRSIGLGLGAVLVILLSAGCNKSPSTSGSAAASSNTVARIHWLGKKKLAADRNAGRLMTIWTMIETANLEAQTLDKLAQALAGSNQLSVISNQLSVTNYRSVLTGPAALARALLDDVVTEESYLELRHTPAQAAELAFAIRLSEDRARIWQTNLAALRDQKSVRSSSFSLSDLTFARAKGWTIVGSGHEKNTVAADMLDRIQRTGAPFVIGASNAWLTVDMDLQRTSDALSLGWKLPKDLPKISMQMTGDGQNVLTRGEWNFPKPLPFQIERWNIPTNIIRGSLLGFRMLQGIRPWLSSVKAWNDLHIGPPPNQLFWWSLQSHPAMTDVAAPLPDASNAVAVLSEFLLQKGTPWLKSNAFGQFLRSTISDGVSCTTGNPLMGPFLQSVQQGRDGFVLAGLARGTATNEPLPAAVIRDFQQQTNLVYFESEGTGAEIQTWLFVGQALRLIFWKAQLPTNSAATRWLKATEHSLGNCTTRVTKTGPSQLTFARMSTVGFDSLELHLLGDWLESPQFPSSLHTLSAPGMVRPGAHRRTNAPPASVPGKKP